MIPMLANPKVQEFLTLLQDPEVKDALDLIFMRFLRDQGITPKLDLLMDFNGLDVDKHCVGSDWEWDNMEPVERMMNKDKKKTVLQPLPDQLALLSERINDASLPVLRETVFSGNETEVRARLLKDHLQDVNMRNGKRFLTSQEVQKYLLYEIDEAHRTTEKAARKVANDVMKKAFEMFPESLLLTKNKKRLNVIVFVEKR
jgi:hypothetical protein